LILVAKEQKDVLVGVRKLNHLLPVTGGKKYTTNSNIKVCFYDENLNPVNEIDVIIKKYKKTETFRVPKGISAISLRFLSK
jgi:hypothetical protein